MEKHFAKKLRGLEIGWRHFLENYFSRNISHGKFAQFLFHWRFGLTSFVYRTEVVRVKWKLGIKNMFIKWNQPQDSGKSITKVMYTLGKLLQVMVNSKPFSFYEWTECQQASNTEMLHLQTWLTLKGSGSPTQPVHTSKHEQ